MASFEDETIEKNGFAQALSDSISVFSKYFDYANPAAPVELPPYVVKSYNAGVVFAREFLLYMQDNLGDANLCRVFTQNVRDSYNEISSDTPSGIRSIIGEYNPRFLDNTEPTSPEGFAVYLCLKTQNLKTQAPVWEKSTTMPLDKQKEFKAFESAKIQIKEEDDSYFAGFIDTILNQTPPSIFAHGLRTLKVLESESAHEDEDEESLGIESTHDGSEEPLDNKRSRTEQKIGERREYQDYSSESISTNEVFQNIVQEIKAFPDGPEPNFEALASSLIVGLEGGVAINDEVFILFLAYANEVRTVGSGNASLTRSMARRKLLSQRFGAVHLIDDILSRCQDERRCLRIHVPMFTRETDTQDTELDILYSYLAVAFTARNTIEKLIVDVDVGTKGDHSRHAFLWIKIVINTILLINGNLKCVSFKSRSQTHDTIFSVMNYVIHTPLVATLLNFTNSLKGVSFSSKVTISRTEPFRLFILRLFKDYSRKHSVTTLKFRIASPGPEFYDTFISQEGIYLSGIEDLRIGASVMTPSLWNPKTSKTETLGGGYFNVPTLFKRRDLHALQRIELNALQSTHENCGIFVDFLSSQENLKVEELHILLPEFENLSPERRTVAKEIIKAVEDTIVSIDIRVKSDHQEETIATSLLVAEFGEILSNTSIPLFSFMVDNENHRFKDSNQRAKYMARISLIRETREEESGSSKRNARDEDGNEWEQLEDASPKAQRTNSSDEPSEYISSSSSLIESPPSNISRVESRLRRMHI